MMASEPLTGTLEQGGSENDDDDDDSIFKRCRVLQPQPKGTLQTSSSRSLPHSGTPSWKNRRAARKSKKTRRNRRSSSSGSTLSSSTTTSSSGSSKNMTGCSSSFGGSKRRSSGSRSRGEPDNSSEADALFGKGRLDSGGSSGARKQPSLRASRRRGQDRSRQHQQQQRLRGKRKRPLDETEKALRKKVVLIEKALRHNSQKDSSTTTTTTTTTAEDDEDYKDDVSCDEEKGVQNIGSSPLAPFARPRMKDLKLNELAIGEYGLINDDLRRRVWPRLVGIDMFEICDLYSQEEVQQHPSYTQVVMDVSMGKACRLLEEVDRSLKRFPPGIADEERPGLQDQLTRLIVRVLIRNPELHYYQGYHDVAITFLLVVGEHVGFHIVERLSKKQLKDFMAPTMEKTTHLLHYMYPIIKRESEELHDFMVKSEVGTIFALPWLITWFSHVLPDYRDVVRLFDYFLAQPHAPMMPVYLAAAIVLHRKQEVLMSECDMAMVHSLLSRIPVETPFEKLLKTAVSLHSKYPPHTLAEDVQERIRTINEQLKQAAEETEHRRKELKARMEGFKGNKPSLNARNSGASGKPWGKDSLPWRVLVAAAPVVVGLVVWRLFFCDVGPELAMPASSVTAL